MSASGFDAADAPGSDVLIVGGGPAGLTAAIYLARFRRSVLLVDAVQSRMSKIPRSHNFPGYVEGVSGQALLESLRTQLDAYPVRRIQACVEAASKSADGFGIRWPTGSARGRLMLVATGLEDIPPAMPHVLESLRAGQLRYCPVCDAYEVSGRKVGVYVDGASGVGEALYLRHFTPHLTLFVEGGAELLSHEDRRRLADAGIRCVEEPVRSIRGWNGHVTVVHGERETACDSLYCALGVRVHAGLARQLGARCDELGYIEVDAHQQTSVDGLYAAGDVARGLNQIVVASAGAAIASSAMHRRLSALR